ncbi:MAG: hypothetical protein ACXVES_07495 [Actinomycetota bacterium]
MADNTGYSIATVVIFLAVGTMIRRIAIARSRKRILDHEPDADLPESANPRGLIPYRALREIAEHNVWRTLPPRERTRKAIQMLSVGMLCAGVGWLITRDWVLVVFILALIIPITLALAIKPNEAGRIVGKAFSPWVFVVIVGTVVIVAIVIAAIHNR